MRFWLDTAVCLAALAALTRADTAAEAFAWIALACYAGAYPAAHSVVR